MSEDNVIDLTAARKAKEERELQELIELIERREAEVWASMFGLRNKDNDEE